MTSFAFVLGTVPISIARARDGAPSGARNGGVRWDARRDRVRALVHADLLRRLSCPLPAVRQAHCSHERVRTQPAEQGNDAPATVLRRSTGWSQTRCRRTLTSALPSRTHETRPALPSQEFQAAARRIIEDTDDMVGAPPDPSDRKKRPVDPQRRQANRPAIQNSCLPLWIIASRRGSGLSGDLGVPVSKHYANN
jgi:hypothetical protein